MAETVRLKHQTRQNSWKMYFYDGSVPVVNGVIELPADNFTRVRRAYGLGFRLTEDGQSIRSNTFAGIVAKATVKQDSPEEQEVEQKSSDSGRQPRTDDRVRTSESDSTGNTSKRRSRSRVSSGTRTPPGQPPTTLRSE